MELLKTVTTCGKSRSMRIMDIDDNETEIHKERQQDNTIRDTEKRPKDGGCFQAEVLTRVFSEDYEGGRRSILDPRGQVARRWNEILFLAGIFSVFIDPLFLFLPTTNQNLCIESGTSQLQVNLTALRSVSDLFYVVNILVQFRTAYVAPSSRVIGRGELVIDPRKIAHRYLRRGLWIDLLSSLPFPQVMTWVIIPKATTSLTADSRVVLRFIPITQYILRLYLLCPLSSKIVKDTGKMTETAWVGAAYNVLLFYIMSNVSGACWYLLTLERQEACWKSVCDQENQTCEYDFFDCRTLNESRREAWFSSTNVTNLCDPYGTYYEYGIYRLALQNYALSEKFIKTYFFCFYWGLQSLVSVGNNLATAGYVGENIFVNLIACVGLVLLAGQVGNMQRYLQSTSLRLEEWRQKRTDTEQWMHYRQIPSKLRKSIRKYDQYKWVATRGVDEKSIMNSLPKDLQRKINHHLCHDLVRRVPLFDQMDEQILDGISERLQPALYTENTYLVREGDPVGEMFFIIRGHLDSSTTNGGQIGFFNSSRLGPGNFCGEELLMWALDRPTSILPSSTRTVKAISEVEAFSLASEDLKFVALQFRVLHSRKLIHKFRFYSHQWRTWAACYIQVAWRRYKKREEMKKIDLADNTWDDDVDIFVPQPGVGIEVYAARIISKIRMGGSNRFDSDTVP